MEVRRLEIPEVMLLVPKKFGDQRGYFSETYSEKSFEAACGPMRFIQDNQAFSQDTGTMRGLHFQIPPMAQSKLIRVLKGAILDVAVDLRQSSKTFGHHVSVQLSAQNWAQLLIPAGFAHGYFTLEPDTEVFYKVDQFYSPDHEKGLAWDDPDLAIAWPQMDNAVLSDKDRNQPSFRQLPAYFP